MHFICRDLYASPPQSHQNITAGSVATSLLAALDRRELTLPDEEARATIEKATEGYEEAGRISEAMPMIHTNVSWRTIASCSPVRPSSGTLS